MLTREIREKILAGEVHGGQQLRQERLAEEFEVSLIPIREALIQLESEGLVRFIPHKGAVVTEISIEDIEEVFALRAMLECDILNYAIGKYTQADFDEVERVIKDFEPLTEPGADMSSWGALNWEFHKALYIPADRPRTFRMIESLNTHCERYLRLQVDILSVQKRAHHEHEQLYALCRNRDKRGAKKLLKAHILQTGEELIEAISR